MAKKNKTTYVKNVEQQEETMDDQKLIDDAGTAEESQQMSPEFMEKFRKSIRDTNQVIYRNMLENVDRLIYEITTKLRKYETATAELADAEGYMYNLEEFTSSHRYTMPIANVAYVDRDVKLQVLAEINLLVESGRYPIGADGKARQLNPMQQAALWY